MRAMVHRAFWATILTALVAVSTRADPPAPNMRPIMIRLRSQVEVGFRTITVGDIAEVSGGNESLCKAISILDIENPPGLHGSIQVTRNLLFLRIRLAGLPVELVRMEGAEATTVHSSQYQPPESEILETASQAVRAHLPSADPEEYQIRFAQAVAMQTMVAGSKEDVSLRAELHHTSGPVLGRVQVTVSILTNGEQQVSFPEQYVTFSPCSVRVRLRIAAKFRADTTARPVCTHVAARR